MSIRDFLAHLPSPVERERLLSLREALEPLTPLFRGRRVLDFGASYGLSACALVELGAEEVVGVEPSLERVELGNRILREIGLSERATLHHTPDSSDLPFRDGSIDVALANAVLEHIPAPRTPYVRELWRTLSADGCLIINESPNKYLPVDFHTTGGLWFVPWLPQDLARRYAIARGRFSATADWSSSGWRGIGYFEIARALTRPYELVPEASRLRHRILARVGLPASLLDPYPTLVFKKRGGDAMPSD